MNTENLGLQVTGFSSRKLEREQLIKELEQMANPVRLTYFEVRVLRQAVEELRKLAHPS